MITLDAVILPEDLHWADEFAWTPVAAGLDYTLSGTALIQVGRKLSGRFVTLEAEDERGWTTRATVLSLKARADEPGKRMILNYHGRTLNVMFAPGETPFDAEPLWREWPDEETDVWVLKTVRLIEITEEEGD